MSAGDIRNEQMENYKAVLSGNTSACVRHGSLRKVLDKIVERVCDTSLIPFRNDNLSKVFFVFFDKSIVNAKSMTKLFCQLKLAPWKNV